MKSGPAPKPTALRLLHGDRPARTNTDEPKSEDGPPICPPETDDAVRAIWDYTLHHLTAMGIAGSGDRDALLTYCEAVVAHRRASAELAITPTLIEGHRGVLIRNPAFALQRDMSTVICRFAHEFGLTPSARSGIRMSGAKSGPEKSADRYLTG